MSAPSKGGSIKTGCILGAIGVPLFLLTFFIAMGNGSPSWPLGLIWITFLGWLVHLAALIQSFPHIWPMVLTLLALVAAGLIIFNLVIRRIATHFQLPALSESSLRFATLCLIPFGAVIAGNEIAQHASQLILSDDLLRPGDYVQYRQPDAHARQLVTALQIYASGERNGRYPARLRDLKDAEVLEPEDWAKMYWYSLPYGEPPVPWIYVLGLNGSGLGDLPVLIAPRALPNGQRIIAFGNGAVDHMSPKAIKEALPKWKTGYSALGVPLPFVLRQYEKLPAP